MKILIYTLSILAILIVIGVVTEQILRYQQLKELKKGQTFVKVD